ncbi:multicopper oxidase domain-containing protein [Micromonospora sp. CA-259024]|uniref:multicopper oxidase family protein n=1 Tax=Micromonospora sp. CA-259024 TaxID=3239965 RepID=UPI003D93070E
MPTAQLIALDLVAAALVAVAWLGAGAAAAARQARLAPALAGVAVLLTVLRFVPALVLAGQGWWFAQEKVTVALPLLTVAALAAAVLAGPPLVRTARAALTGQAAANPAPQTPSEPTATPATGSTTEPAAEASRTAHPAGDVLDRPAVVVPLLTAGYAAAAGLVLTFLIGYPTTLAAALVTVALVAAATLITWQVTAPARTRSRRIAAAAALAIGLAGVGLAVLPEDPVDIGAGRPVAYPPAHGTPVAALRGSPGDMAQGGTVRRTTLTAQKGNVTLTSGRTVSAWTYNGQVPGPSLTAEEGDLIEVTLRNKDIERGVTVHWHGYDVPAAEDGAPGVTQDAVMPGQEYVYRFAARQVGTYWYHTHQVSDIGVRMGLYGTLIVRPKGTPPDATDLTLPVHKFGGVTALGTHDDVYDETVPSGRPVRLRLINTDSDPRRFALVGTPFRLSAVDGRDLNGPGELTDTGLVLPAGGRYDVSFTMPAGPVQLVVGDDPGRGVRLVPPGTVAATPEADTRRWPDLDLLSYGEPAPMPIDRSAAFNRDFTMVLGRNLALAGSLPRYAQTINGRAHPSTPTQVVEEGDLVRMRIVNRSAEIHPWHLHGHTVVVLARDGEVPTGSPLRLDSFDVRPGEVWEIGFRANNPGLWMNHCHNLPHQEQGMAIHLGYAGITDSFHSGDHSAHGG